MIKTSKYSVTFRLVTKIAEKYKFLGLHLTAIFYIHGYGLYLTSNVKINYIIIIVKSNYKL